MFSFFSPTIAYAAYNGVPFCDPATIGSASRADIVVCRIIHLVIDPVIFFLIAVALLMFMWGVMQFLINQSGGEEKSIAQGKQSMIWGLVGLLIMVSVYGIMHLVANSIGAKNTQNQSLDSQIPKSQDFKPGVIYK